MICTCTLSSDTFGYIDATTNARLCNGVDTCSFNWQIGPPVLWFRLRHLEQDHA